MENNGYTIKQYDTAKIFLDSGWYNKNDILDILDWFNNKTIERALNESIRPIQDDKTI